MTTFIQLHLLTAYAPSNLNRDEDGFPKTAKMGGVDRLRISSQSLKRAWRTSSLFQSALSEHIGTRTRRLGHDVYDDLIKGGMADKLAFECAAMVAGQFGKLKSDKNPKDPLDNLDIEQIVHVSNRERDLIKALLTVLINENRKPTDEELKLLRKENNSVDIALFGRMLASKPEFDIEAACQVSHALGVSAVIIEDDFFTAVDDLNKAEDAGSAHMGNQGFASALFYTYICISRDLLLENLGGNEELVEKTLKALTETAATVSPSGKQNSFASRAYASYILAEKGDKQPRSLAVAFFNPVRGENVVVNAIAFIEDQVKKFDKTYGCCAESRYTLNSEAGEGNLAELTDFVSKK